MAPHSGGHSTVYVMFTVPVRTIDGQAYRIRELHLHFYREDMMFKPLQRSLSEQSCLPSADEYFLLRSPCQNGG